MNDSQYVRIEGLQESALDIKTKKNLIMNIYDTKIKQILYESEQCITQSGQNYDEVKKSMRNSFLELETNLTELADLLTNIIIPNYEETKESIAKVFNADFANEMQKFLELEKDNNE